MGGSGPLSSTMLLGTTRASLPNGISFCPTALAGCTSVTDGWMDHATVTSVTTDSIAEMLSALAPKIKTKTKQTKTTDTLTT